jgi:hypothetical protein
MKGWTRSTPWAATTRCKATTGSGRDSSLYTSRLQFSTA